MRLRIEWIGMFLTLGLVMGCATLRGMGAKHEHIETQTKNYVYNQSAQSVWPAARQILFEKGFEVKNTGEAGMFDRGIRVEVRKQEADALPGTSHAGL